MRAALAALLALGATGAGAETMAMRYSCERGVEIPVVYVNGVEPAVAVIHVEGRLIALEAEEAASGVRYGWPSDGSHYVWWTRGEGEAMLIWADGETGEEVTLYRDCAAQ